MNLHVQASKHVRKQMQMYVQAARPRFKSIHSFHAQPSHAYSTYAGTIYAYHYQVVGNFAKDNSTGKSMFFAKGPGHREPGPMGPGPMGPMGPGPKGTGPMGPEPKGPGPMGPGPNGAKPKPRPDLPKELP